MKFKFTHNDMTFESDFSTVKEKNELIKLIKYTIRDVDKMLNDLDNSGELEVCPETSKTAQMADESEVDNKISMLPPELATDGQKMYMDKIGVKYTDETTKIEAIDLINEWKRKQGIKVDEELSNKVKQRRATK